MNHLKLVDAEYMKRSETDFLMPEYSRREFYENAPELYLCLRKRAENPSEYYFWLKHKPLSLIEEHRDLMFKAYKEGCLHCRDLFRIEDVINAVIRKGYYT